MRNSKARRSVCPKLRSDTLYVPSPNGTYLTNNKTSLILPGEQTYRWIERLAPHLNGKNTLDSLTSGLPESKRQAVEDLVRFLLERGFATDVAADVPDGLRPEEKQAYADELSFIEYFRDSPGHRFEAFRSSRVLVSGSGRLLDHLVTATLHCGLKEVHVVGLNGAPGTHDRLTSAARQRDPRQRLIRHAAPDWNNAESVRATLRGYDVVMHAVDRPFLSRAGMINQVCLEQETTSVQAIVLGNQAWIGPLTGPRQTAGCWECAWRRAWTRLSDEPFELRDHPEDEPSEFLTSPPAAIIASHAVFEVFKSLTGAGPLETIGAMVRIDLETLGTSRHRFSPHPLCSRIHSTTAADGSARPAITGDDDFAVQAGSLFDHRTGVLSDVSERDFVQIPLKVSEATFPDPVSGRLVAVYGAGQTVKISRVRAVREACERYAARVAQATGRVEARNLVTSEPMQVPIATAFPVSRLSPGIASGYCEAEAACRGLAGHAAALAIGEFSGKGDPAPKVGIAGNDDERVARHLRTLAAARQEYAVYDVTGELGAPVFAFVRGDRTVAWVSDLDVTVAIAAGLERIVLDMQSATNDQGAYRPTAEELPTSRRGDKTTPPTAASGMSGSWDHRLGTWRGLFLKRGLVPVLVPLDQDRTVIEVLPAVVNMLLMPYA